ncbi:MAG: ATPase [Hyphomicrobiales bacterium]|nr:MAG: ATPase [Hyphomicrobiales bacterium]
MSKPRFVYVTFIATTPEKLWQALTDPEMTPLYWFGYTVDVRGKAGARMTARDPSGKLVHDDPIIESDPPHRLVYAWKSLYDEFKDEGPSRVTFELEPKPGQVKLTVTHEEFEPDSRMFPRISQGWPAVLSSLKSILETGKALPSTMAKADDHAAKARA